MSEYTSKHSRNDVKKKHPLRRLFGFIGRLLLIIILLAAALIGFLSATEYKPSDIEELAVDGDASGELAPGDSFTVMTWNIGYGALGDNADFFMDGGKGVKTADEQRVQSNMEEVCDRTASLDPDVIFYQEADIDSARSEHINEYLQIQGTLPDYCSSFGSNFKVKFLPYPVPPIGKVDSGIATFSRCQVSGAQRVQLPIPFSWPVRMANLKRCALISRVPLRDTDKELVLVNLHLEAYDDGAGKKLQTEKLAGILEEEREKGNYVIAGGDFNQSFSSADLTGYEAQPGKWAAGLLPEEEFGKGWQFLMDDSVPSCRSLDQPYAGADKESFQYYLIDGFIVSDNIKVTSLNTQDLGFVVSDHNPVFAELELNKQ